ncbi:hypothetical protein TorRG33x02_097340 [Trema orientale]|uniref:Uncharacterized protein n=1 Tax=Trema orientale TaxID=63057 RepID=A0A2P5F9M6_TREOI|nr:hypothetical protein TorRG33x02_097340 [Trema orientale]
MKWEYGINVGYKRACRAKEKALEILLGSDAESYTLSPSFAYILEASNPGSIIALETEGIEDEEDGMVEHFKYFFMSMSAFIQGWPHYRPVILVDGSYYHGTLFTACAMDINEQVFPPAFGIGDSESNAA